MKFKKPVKRSKPNKPVVKPEKGAPRSLKRKSLKPEADPLRAAKLQKEQAQALKAQIEAERARFEFESLKNALNDDISGRLELTESMDEELAHLKPVQRAFLEAYAQTSIVALAAKHTNISRYCHYKWMREDAYKKSFEEVVKPLAAQVIEDEAIRRAVQGWLAPIYHKGVLCGSERKFDSRLHEVVLKGAMGDKYAQRLDQTIKDEASDKVVALSELFTLDQLEEARARANSLGAADGRTVV